MTEQELLALDPEILAEIDSTFDGMVYERHDELCRREVASFDAGPLYWLTHLTKTENPQYEAQGLPLLAPFPKHTQP